jgi:hypothetical protein
MREKREVEKGPAYRHGQEQKFPSTRLIQPIHQPKIPIQNLPTQTLLPVTLIPPIPHIIHPDPHAKHRIAGFPREPLRTIRHIRIEIRHLVGERIHLRERQIPGNQVGVGGGAADGEVGSEDERGIVGGNGVVEPVAVVAVDGRPAGEGRVAEDGGGRGEAEAGVEAGLRVGVAAGVGR